MLEQIIWLGNEPADHPASPFAKTQVALCFLSQRVALMTRAGDGTEGKERQPWELIALSQSVDTAHSEEWGDKSAVLGSLASPPSAFPWVELCVLIAFENWSTYWDLKTYLLRKSKSYVSLPPSLLCLKFPEMRMWFFFLSKCLDHGDGLGLGVLTWVVGWLGPPLLK